MVLLALLITFVPWILAIGGYIFVLVPLAAWIGERVEDLAGQVQKTRLALTEAQEAVGAWAFGCMVVAAPLGFMLWRPPYILHHTFGFPLRDHGDSVFVGILILAVSGLSLTFFVLVSWWGMTSMGCLIAAYWIAVLSVLAPARELGSSSNVSQARSTTTPSTPAIAPTTCPLCYGAGNRLTPTEGSVYQLPCELCSGAGSVAMTEERRRRHTNIVLSEAQELRNQIAPSLPTAPRRNTPPTEPWEERYAPIKDPMEGWKL